MIGYNSMVGHSESIAMNQYSQIAADSLIEMNLLSKCKIIVKTKESTFGEMARIIGGHRINYYYWLFCCSKRSIDDNLTDYEFS